VRTPPKQNAATSAVPPPDVHHHVDAPLQWVDAATHRARDRLVDRGHRTDAGLVRGFEERPALECGRPDRCPDDGVRRAGPQPPSRLVQDRTQVDPGRLQVRDHTVVQRSDRDEPGREAVHELSGVLSGGHDPLAAATITAQQQEGRLVQDDAPTDVADHGVGRAQIDTQFHVSPLVTGPSSSLEPGRGTVQASSSWRDVIAHDQTVGGAGPAEAVRREDGACGDGSVSTASDEAQRQIERDDPLSSSGSSSATETAITVQCRQVTTARPPAWSCETRAAPRPRIRK